jgi:fatty acid amide hydrolase
MRHSYWEKEASIVRRDRDVRIESFLREHRDFELPNDRKRYILSLSASELVRQIKSRSITAVEALLTYIHRTVRLGRELSLIADINFDAAVRMAQDIDQRIKEKEITDDLILLGLPISIKDHMGVKGCLMTAGFTSRSNYLVGEDCDLVAVLKSKGAIPFVMSNTSLGMFAFESFNRLWGNSMNPWHKKKTTGGSSGGEAGLVASRCSPCGIGSDVGGSIRQPAAFCGIYGFKPTSKRVSLQGVYNNLTGLYSTQFSLGPMCRSIDDIALLLRAMFGNFSDPTVYNLPYNEVLYNDARKIKIAYMTDTNYYETAPVIKSLLTEIAEKLMKKGHELVPIRFEMVNEIVEIGSLLLFNSGGIEDILKTLNGEEPDPYDYNFIYLRYSSNWWIRFLNHFTKITQGHRIAKMGSYLKNITQIEYSELCAKLKKLRDDYYKFLQVNNIEAIICPVFPTPATNLNSGDILESFGHFVSMFNYLDMPAGTVPLILNTNLDYESRHNDNFTKHLTETLKDSVNLPVAIQVAALPNQDEMCLRIMKDIDSFYSFDLNIGNTIIDKLDIELYSGDKVDIID